MKRKLVALIVIISILILSLGIYFFLSQNESQPETEPENELEEQPDVDISFESSAELRKTDNWRFHLKLLFRNNLNSTVEISWFWMNTTRIAYVSGAVGSLGISSNFTEQILLGGRDSKMAEIVITEFGFQSEPKELSGEVKIKIAKIEKPLLFNFHISREEGNLEKVTNIE